MNDNPLQLDALTAVVAGGGAIGCALAQALIDNPRVQQVYLLCRDPARQGLPSGARHLHLDALDPGSASTAAERVGAECQRVHLLINTVGVLHDGDKLQPEKRLAQLSPEKLLHAFQVNTLLLPALASAFSRLLRHDEPAMLASLSARVGSIEDNRSGGWYSYRASKAAHNMLLRTLAREWRISHSRTIVAALHPGTVASPLSAPFVSNRYPHRVLEPAESAAALLRVMASLGPGDSGSFHDWQGEPIPW